MPPLIEAYKSKRTCPECNAQKLFTNDNEKLAKETTIHYHCLGCNNQFSEHPRQKEARDRREKMKDSSTNNPSVSKALIMIALLLSTILLVNLARQNEEQQNLEQPISLLSGSAL